MELTELIHFCRCQYQLYEIPLRIFQSGKIVCRMDNSSIGSFEEERERLAYSTMLENNSQSVYFGIQASLLLEGAVFAKDSDLVVYVGAARGVYITKPIVRRYLQTMGVNDLSEESISRIQLYMNNMPVVAPGLFVVFLSALNTFINGEVVEPGIIFARNIVGQADTEIQTRMLDQREKRYFGVGPQNVNYMDTEDRFLFYVRNGMVEELKKFCSECAGFEVGGSAENPDAWRMTKDKVITGVAIVSRAAIKAGLSSMEAAQLCDLYIQKAELCSTGKMLNEVRYDALIDFTERVRELKIRRTDNQLVNRVIDNIMQHMEDDLTLSGLAAQFGVNKNYLSGIFKAETGMGVTDFIHSQKINMAKQLLRYTDKSLIEIANYLCFCSQSYFQQVFKKVAGVTPTDYRNDKRKSIT